MTVDRAAVLADLASWEGWREGPNNENPFGPYQGIANAAYCDSFADGEPSRVADYDHNVGLPEGGSCQFDSKGDAYTPWAVGHAKERGEWVDDHASLGQPCDLLPADQVFFAWNNGAGPDPDHVETVQAVYDDLSFDTTGANTGSPNGVWRVRRDRTYLLGRRRPHLYDGAPPPPPPPPTTGGSRGMIFRWVHGNQDWLFDGPSHLFLTFNDVDELAVPDSDAVVQMGEQDDGFHDFWRGVAQAASFTFYPPGI